MRKKTLTEEEINLKDSCNHVVGNGQIVAIQKKNGRWYMMFVVDGQWCDSTYHRFSNSWTLRHVMEDGTLGKRIPFLYDNMYYLKREYKVHTEVIVDLS